MMVRKLIKHQLYLCIHWLPRWMSAGELGRLPFSLSGFPSWFSRNERIGRKIWPVIFPKGTRLEAVRFHDRHERER